MGIRLHNLAFGRDPRRVRADEQPRSISSETTFHDDTADRDVLDGHIWRLSEKVTDRAKATGLAGSVVTLKLKRADHRLLTRRESLREPTLSVDTVYRHARALFDQTPPAGPYRLIGVGLSDLAPAAGADRTRDLLDPHAARLAEAERATDRIRARFGPGAIIRGRTLR